MLFYLDPSSFDASSAKTAAWKGKVAWLGDSQVPPHGKYYPHHRTQKRCKAPGFVPGRPILRHEDVREDRILVAPEPFSVLNPGINNLNFSIYN